MWLKEGLQKRKRRNETALYDRGFDYAIGALVRGHKTPRELNTEQAWEEVGESRNSFDYGMNAAIRDAIKLGIVKDNRV